LEVRNRGLTIRELIEEQRRGLRWGNPVERLAAALLIPGVLRERMHRLGDRPIGQLLLDEVWSRLNPLHPESTICLHAVDRLRGSALSDFARHPACPTCGSAAYLHWGIEEPDFWQCDLVSCNHKWQVASDNIPGSPSPTRRDKPSE
jgi:hypothetical protein